MAQDGDEREVVVVAASPRPTNGWHGTVLAGTYRVLQRLGKGGMGEVYEAEHLRLEKRVAVKFMNGDALGDRRAHERFRREVRALSAITSEHVVNVLDCGELDGETPYLVMERLQGEDLRHVIAREGQLSVYRALRLALDACTGLAAVHAAGLIHRDLKPANLFVMRSKTHRETCKILDFGVAKGQASDATGQGALLGTVRYMAPEQLSNSASVTPATDVYALGAILFECLTGRPAHDADSPEELMFAVLNRDPPLATELRPGLPPELDDIIRYAMARRPDDRFQSVTELAAVLEPLLPSEDANDTARDTSEHDRPAPRPRRPHAAQRAKIAVVAALGGLVLGFALSKLTDADATTDVSAEVAQTETLATPPTPVTAPSFRPSTPKPVPAATEHPASDVQRSAPSAPVASTRPQSTPNPTASVAAGRSARPVAVAKRTPPPESPRVKREAAPAAVVLDVENPYEE